MYNGARMLIIYNHQWMTIDDWKIFKKHEMYRIEYVKNTNYTIPYRDSIITIHLFIIFCLKRKTKKVDTKMIWT